MDYVLLTPDETAELLGLTDIGVIALVESGGLAGLRVAGQWRVPLKGVVQYLEASTGGRSVSAIERVFNDPAAWHRVFGAHPEVTQAIPAGEFPKGSVGGYLRQAIDQQRRKQDGQLMHGAAGNTRQDEDYRPPPASKSA